LKRLHTFVAGLDWDQERVGYERSPSITAGGVPGCLVAVEPRPATKLATEDIFCSLMLFGKNEIEERAKKREKVSR